MGSSPKAATCHPERKHLAKGLCGPCYYQQPEIRAKRKICQDRWNQARPKKGRPAARKPECHPDRPHCAKGLCKTCYSQQPHIAVKRKISRDRWKKSNPGYSTEWARQNRESQANSRRKSVYGLTREQYHQMLTDQGNLCKICQKGPPTDVDHDHNTGVVRGLLCSPCNRGLGTFKDDPEVLRSAAMYIESSRVREGVDAASVQ